MKLPRNKKLRVLIVEDNKVDCRMLTGMLSHAPFGCFDVKIVNSLNLAFKSLDAKKFDVALLDLNLDDSTGLYSLKKLNKRYPSLPIVINTGSYPDDLGLKAVTIGAQDYLIKGKYKSYGLSKSLYYAVERKKAEQEIQSAYNKLKDTQSKLIQAEKMSAVGGIASGIAHEVKNPLATILYGVEFLNTSLNHSDDNIKLTLDSIKEASQKANNIIKDLLEFASLSNLKKSIEDINEVIGHALNLTHHQCEKRGISVVKTFDSNLPKIKIDRNRIEQVLLDLLLNAINAMKDKGVLTIRTYSKKLTQKDISLVSKNDKKLRLGDNVVIVEIDDTGTGIPPENLSKIFDPFFTTHRASGGVGLGLSIARTIMQNHNGNISLENIEGGVNAKLVFKS